MEKLKKLQSWILAYEKANEREPTVLEIKERIDILVKSVASDKIDFDKMICYYNKVLGKNTRVLSQKAKEAFNKRMKEGYTKQDIVKVIDNSFSDSLHKENDYKYVTLEFLSRPQIFERYSSMKHNKPASLITDAFINQ